MSFDQINPLAEKAVSLWVRIQEKLLEEERQKEKAPVQMICVEEYPKKR